MKDLININRLNRFGQNIWTRIKNTFMTKEDAINGILVGQEWTLIGSATGNNSIILPPTDSFTELYIEMYSSNGTISHNINIKIDSILFESDNMEYREILLDSVYDAQTYVRYDFATNSIIPIMYEGNTILTYTSNVTTRVYTKTNNLEVGNVEAEKIMFDNSASGMYSDNVQGAIDELKCTIGYSKKNLLNNTLETSTVNGITFTTNSDKSVTINGTATEQTPVFLNYDFKKGGKYIISGCPEGGAYDTYFVTLFRGAAGMGIYDYGEGLYYVSEADETLRYTIIIRQGQNVNNLVFKPMIRYASIEDNTYEPYVSSLDENFGVITQWTPKGTIQQPVRNYYIKTKNTLKIWFCLQCTSAINETNTKFIICDNVLQTFGVKSARNAWNPCLCLNSMSAPWKYYRGVVDCVNNVLCVEYYGETIPVNTTVYGFIEIGIND